MFGRGKIKVKFTKILITFIIAILISAQTVSANTENSSKDEVVYFQSEEIKDIELLRDRAKKGITDLVVKKNKSVLIKENKKDKSKNIEIPINEYQTTQKLKVVKDSNDDIITSYVTTVFVDITEEAIAEEEEKENTLNLGFLTPVFKFLSESFGPIKAYAGSKSDETSGSSYSVRSYSTIYWQERGSGVSREFRLTSANGGWTRLDSAVSMSNRTVRLGQSNAVTPDYKPTSNTYNYNAPTSWSWLNANCTSCFVGSTSEITITRGSSSWKQVLTNNKQGWPQN